MVKLQINSKDVLLMIMDYLREHNMLSSLLALEKESALSLFKCPNREIQFLRTLVLEGQWQHAEDIVKTIFKSLFNDQTLNESQSDILFLN